MKEFSDLILILIAKYRKKSKFIVLVLFLNKEKCKVNINKFEMIENLENEFEKIKM